MSERIIFQKPAGPSERGWCNMKMGTTRGLTCEVCGTTLEELDEDDASYRINQVLGLQCIDECCGKAIDVLYEEFGEDFTMAFLHDFANNPSDSKFGLLRQVLVDLTKAARKKLREVDEQLKEVEVGAGER